MTTELVDPDAGLRIHLGRTLPPGGASDLVPLAGAQRLFFRVQPSAVMTRLTVAVENRTPDCCSHQAQCSASVASDATRRRAGRAARRATVVDGGGPCRGRG